MNREDIIDRQTGRTTEQMRNAPSNSVFVWVHGHLFYPRRLAERIGRQDLEIVGPSWLENKWMGRELSGLVIDHAAHPLLTDRQREALPYAFTRVRPPVAIAKATGGEV